MCLAIYKPADTAPDWTAYKNGFEDNPDGWGFAVVDNGELLDATGIGNFEEFRTNFEPFAHKQAIIHFRWATHGSKTVDNCHPFVHGDLAMIHNGIVNICTKSDESRSDTYHFMDKVIIPMYERDRDFFLQSDVKYTMELAHSGSKFVLLRADGQYAIWNEDDGVKEKDGHWYSNTGYLTSRYYGSYWSRGSSTTTATKSRSIIVPSGATLSDVKDEADEEKAKFIDLDWTKADWDRWADSVDSDSRLATLNDDDTAAEEATDDYIRKLRNDLLDWGMSREAIEEVGELFGWSGLEALWDAR
jgi:glutamine amidotransferase